MASEKKKGCSRLVLWGGGTAGVIALILSWIVNRSVGWALLHFCCGIFYIIYWIFTYMSDVFPNLF